MAPKPQLKSLSYAIKIINLLEDRVSLSVYEIADILDVPRSTTYKYLSDLRQHGFVSYDEQTEKYKLGLRLYILGSKVESQIEIGRIALPFMQELVQIVNETVAVNILSNDVAVNIERVGVENKSGIVFYMKKGTHLPLYAGAAGKILLAYQPEDKIKRYIKQTSLKKLTKNTTTNPDKLRTHLKEIREAGVAVSKQEIIVGACAVAAPIYNIHQKVIAGLVVTGPIQRLDDKKLQKNKKIVIEYARKISGKCSS